MEIYNDFSTSVEKALTEIKPDWKKLPGIVICGTHSPRNVEQLIKKVEYARVHDYPYLGICFGYQLGAIEYARSVKGIKDATSEEWGTEGTFVVKKMGKLRVGLHDGESYWHEYEVDFNYSPLWNFHVSQFHPEYQSSKDHPHPLLVKFIKYAEKYMAVQGGSLPRKGLRRGA